MLLRALTGMAAVLVLASSVKAKPGFTESKLCVAVENGNIVRVRTVLEQGSVDVNDGCTVFKSYYPLGVAAKHRLVNIGSLLLEYGAGVNTKEILGYSAISYAAENLDVEFMKILLENQADVNSKLINLEGLKLGDDLMSMAAAAYLREYPFMSVGQRNELTVTFYEVINLLHHYCFDFVENVSVAHDQLTLQNHMDEANYISKKANEAQNDCPPMAII